MILIQFFFYVLSLPFSNAWEAKIKFWVILIRPVFILDRKT